MEYRIEKLLAEEAITTAGTKVVDLRGADPISVLAVGFNLTNNGYAPSGHPIDIIKTIRVVDGSDVIFSLEGCDAQAVAYYSAMLYLNNWLSYYDNGITRIKVPIYFGRRMYDAEYALVPRNFGNLQLKIEHDYSLGGCTPDGATLEVDAVHFDEKAISPVGFLQNKEVKAWTSSAGATETIQLDTEFPLRKIFFSAKHDDEEPDVHFRTIEIREERGKRVPVEIDGRDLIRLIQAHYPIVRDYGDGYVQTDSRDLYFTAHKDLQVNMEMAGAEQATGVSWTGGRKRTCYLTNDKDFNFEATGLCPHGVMCFDPVENDLSESFRWPRGLDHLELRVTHRAVLGNTTTCRILTQQVRGY